LSFSSGVVLGGDGKSYAQAVSADGSFVFGSANMPSTPGGSEAFVWDSVHGMRTVRTVLTNDLGLDLTGWVLSEVMDCSADGLTMAGNGFDPEGYLEPWIAHVPEPATLSLLLLGGLAVLRWR
jgi:uncharacterized membrane protein